ncbi:MAG: ComEC/Rec2 family competence protein [Chloroflexi bacterium]|nr:ComEC/Rec2 family competence protein [Chloroflexota bacterium]
MTRILGPAFLVGIVLGTVFPPFPLVVLALLLVSCLGLAAMGMRPVALGALLLLAGVLGMVRTHTTETASAAKPLNPYLAQSVTLRGWVASEPVRSERSTRVRFNAESRWVDDTWQPISGQVWVTLPPRLSAQYGMEWELSGRLEALESLNSPSYQRYLERRGAQALLAFPQVEFLSGERGQPILRALYGVKERLLGVMEEILPRPHAPLRQGILLGARAGIPATLRQAFDLSGTTHLIAISGFNMTIVAIMLESVTRRFFGRRSLWISMAGVAFYTILVGANPAVVRAAVMAILLLFAATLGRDRDPWSALALAAVAMTAWEPTILWDVGFQLSVAATAGLLVLSNPLHDRLRWLPYPLPAIVAPTLAAQLFVLPLLIFVFGRVSPFFLISNVLALPLIPWIMLSGAVATAAGLIHTATGQVLAWSAYLPMEAFIRIATEVSRWPSFTVSPGALLPAAVAVILTAIVVAWTRHRVPESGANHSLESTPLSWTTIFSLGTVGSILFVLWGSVAADFNRQPSVTLIERSLGSTVMIQTANRRPLLIGFREPPSGYDLDRLLPIWQRNNTLWIGGSETLQPRNNVGAIIQSDGENWQLQAQEANERLASGDQYRIALGASDALHIYAERTPEFMLAKFGNQQLAIIQSSASVDRVLPVEVLIVQGAVTPARLAHFIETLQPHLLLLDEPWPDVNDVQWRAQGIKVVRPPPRGYVTLRWDGQVWQIVQSEREEI